MPQNPPAGPTTFVGVSTTLVLPSLLEDSHYTAFFTRMFLAQCKVVGNQHIFLEVIILTGHGSLESAVECTKLGAYGYLPKPYELEQLIELLKEAYQTRMQKKYEHDQARMDMIAKIAMGDSALGIMRRLRELDDDEK